MRVRQRHPVHRRHRPIGMNYLLWIFSFLWIFFLQVCGFDNGIAFMKDTDPLVWIIRYGFIIIFYGFFFFTGVRVNSSKFLEIPKFLIKLIKFFFPGVRVRQWHRLHRRHRPLHAAGGRALHPSGVGDGQDGALGGQACHLPPGNHLEAAFPQEYSPWIYVS